WRVHFVGTRCSPTSKKKYYVSEPVRQPFLPNFVKFTHDPRPLSSRKRLIAITVLTDHPHSPDTYGDGRSQSSFASRVLLIAMILSSGCRQESQPIRAEAVFGRDSRNIPRVGPWGESVAHLRARLWVAQTQVQEGQSLRAAVEVR